MDLQLANGAVIVNPTLEQIREALLTLEEFDNPFAILNKSYHIYMQASIDFSTPGYILEYQMESVDHYYQSINKKIPIESIIKAFQMYAIDDDSWKDQFQWQKMRF